MRHGAAVCRPPQARYLLILPSCSCPGASASAARDDGSQNGRGRGHGPSPLRRVAPGAHTTPKGPCADGAWSRSPTRAARPSLQEPPLPAGCPSHDLSKVSRRRHDRLPARQRHVRTRTPRQGRADAQACILFDRGCRLGDCHTCWRSTATAVTTRRGCRNVEAALAARRGRLPAGDPELVPQARSIHGRTVATPPSSSGPATSAPGPPRASSCPMRTAVPTPRMPPLGLV